MAEVWLATDMSLGRQVAVKVLKSGLATDPIVAERFRREAITVARLSHPNIVAVHDTIDFDGRQAVVMQFINGKSLRELLDEQKRLSPELTMHVGGCVAAALDAAHSAGLVHRDVKPGNILITPDGRVLLADFGIAKGLGSSDDLTSENVMMGTAKYLSPEQVRGKKLDGRADLYALGLVLYECLAGRVPFIGDSDADTALARLQRDPTDLAVLRPTLPHGLADLIHSLLARNPTDRPATGGALKAALTRVASRVDDLTTTLTPAQGTTLRGVDTATLPIDSTPTRVSQPIIRAEARRSGGDEPRSFTPRGAARPINAPPPVRDRTPTSGSPRGAPARNFEQRRAPVIAVMLLLLLAVIVTSLLWPSGDTAPGQPFVPLTVQQSPTTAVAQQGSVTIAAISSFDPDDTEFRNENPTLVDLVNDANPATAWSTNCYQSQYFGGKVGVGLTIELSAPAQGAVSITMANAPYQLEVFSSNADTAPTSIESWGAAMQPTIYSADPGSVSVPIDNEASRFVLVLLHEVGRDSACSSARPFRGSISSISFAASN